MLFSLYLKAVFDVPTSPSEETPIVVFATGLSKDLRALTHASVLQSRGSFQGE